MNYPPSKRLRGLAPGLDPVLDPFEEDFTQDDLDEIDVIASQAITTATGGGAEPSVGRHNSELGNGAAQGSVRLLEAELKRKLQEVEEDIVMKSGEIRVLRDSLRAAQQEAETQRQKQIQIQSQHQHDQSLKEKELLKKVQSLQSQLQFKEAEMNEMRSKVLSDRRSSPLSRSSPKLQLSSPTAGGFITKESFSAQVSSSRTPGEGSRRTTQVKTPLMTQRQEVTRPDPFLSIRPPRPTHSGSVLLGLLLEPVSPTVSLCHLLSLSSPSSLVGNSCDVISSVGSALSPFQSLALTGLSMIGHNRTSSCPGAVLLLPLLKSHLSQLCQSLDSNGGLPSCTSAAGGPSPVPECTRAWSKAEEPGLSRLTVEECGLVALKTLTVLLTHSHEVVEAVLSEEAQSRTTNTQVDSHSQKALLPCVLRLCQARQRPDIVCNALTSLRVLVQRTGTNQVHRLRLVLPEVCASSDQRLKVVSECVSILTSIIDQHKLTQQLCSQHDPCVLLRLMQLIRSRSDPEATQSDWVQLDLKVVQLLSRLLTQSPTRSFNQDCPCYSQLVQCMVLVLHRLWLDTRSSRARPTQALSLWCRGCVLASLQETVLLLHWLLQNHSGFTESCRAVLHLYDQVIPALRESLQETSYSQELALDEICRSEADDDMDTDSGS